VEQLVFVEGFQERRIGAEARGEFHAIVGLPAFSSAGDR
jgi:hypothetical protein